MTTNFFSKKRILITGANGFIGKHLFHELDSQGASISVLTRQNADFNSHTKIFIGDLQDPKFVDDCIKQSQPEFVFHLAAFKSRSYEIESFYEAINVNLMGSLNLLTAIKKLKNISSVIMVGTAEEYGQNPTPFTEESREHPINAYSFSKLCVTQLCQTLNNLYHIPCVVLRPTLIYGPGQDQDMFLPSLIQSLIQNKKFPMTAGHQTRDFLYISDFIQALIKAAMTPQVAGEIINIGSGQSITIKDLAMKVEKQLEKSGLLQIGALQSRPSDIMNYVASIQKAKDLLHWTHTTSLDDGLKKTIQYYLTQPTT